MLAHSQNLPRCTSHQARHYSTQACRAHEHSSGRPISCEQQSPFADVENALQEEC